MPIDTSYLGLTQYDSITDASELFSDFRNDLAGASGSSNMQKVDDFAQAVSASSVSGSYILADDVVENNAYLDASITGSKIANATITGSKIVDNSISGEKILDSTITGSKIPDGGIPTGKLENPYETMYLKVIGADETLSSGDGQMHFTIPELLNTKTITDVHGAIYTPSVSGSVVVQIHNVTDAVDVLNTLVTIEEGEYNSYDASAQPVVGNGDIATGDIMRIDVDGSGSSVGGLDVIVTIDMS